MREPRGVGRLRARRVVRDDPVRRAAALELGEQGRGAGERTARVEQHAVDIEEDAAVMIQKLGDLDRSRLGHGWKIARQGQVLYEEDEGLPRPLAARAG